MHFFSLSQCNQLGNNLKDVVDKYKKYDDSSASLFKWLNSSEEEARKQQSETIAADPQTLQKQLEETKARNTTTSLILVPVKEIHKKNSMAWVFFFFISELLLFF